MSQTATGGLPPLVLVAHGSRDPRAAEVLHRLARRVGRARPGLDVRLCFLEHALPSLEQALGAISGSAVVVPLLLGRAYHARWDLPPRVVRAEAADPLLTATVTGTLAPDPRLEQLLLARVRYLGDRADGIVLIATGTSDDAANAEIAAVAARLEAAAGLPVAPGLVTAGPGVSDAVRSLRGRGCAELAVLRWVLAPGRLLDAGLAAAARLGGTAAASRLADSAALADVDHLQVGTRGP
jgi:sirohydrochlorin ferrochelatase